MIAREQVEVRPGEAKVCSEKKRNVSHSKTKYMCGTVRLQRVEVMKVPEFKCLG